MALLDAGVVDRAVYPLCRQQAAGERRVEVGEGGSFVGGFPESERKRGGGWEGVNSMGFENAMRFPTRCVRRLCHLWLSFFF